MMMVFCVTNKILWQIAIRALIYHIRLRMTVKCLDCKLNFIHNFASKSSFWPLLFAHNLRNFAGINYWVSIFTWQFQHSVFWKDSILFDFFLFIHLFTDGVNCKLKRRWFSNGRKKLKKCHNALKNAKIVSFDPTLVFAFKSLLTIWILANMETHTRKLVYRIRMDISFSLFSSDFLLLPYLTSIKSFL